MKWITREHVKVDRAACPWLIRKFVDPQAEILFVPADKVMEIAEREQAVPFDVPKVEFGHQGKEGSFEAILKKHHLTDNPALVLLGKIVNGADTDNTVRPPGRVYRESNACGNCSPITLPASARARSSCLRPG